MDPMAIRSYLASLGQGAPGGAGAGGAQGMLANLRNQLYGPQALQQLGGQGGQLGGPGAVGQAPNDGPALLDPNSPAAQFYRNALEGRNMSGAGGPGGAGAASGGFSNLPMTLDPASLVRPDLVGGGAQGGNAAPAGAQGASANAAGMPFGVPPRLQELAARDPAAAQARFAAFQAGQLPGQQGGAADQGGVSTETKPLPATMTAPAGGAAPTMTAPVTGNGPSAAVANVRQAVQQAKPMRPPQSGGQAAGPNPAVLGAQDFKGPNARRIVQARGGIYNNVRNALRKPGAGGGR